LHTQEDGNDSLEMKNFRSMSHAAERNTTLDEYWEIVKMTFATEGDAYIFCVINMQGKVFSVRKHVVRHA
jgi:hypothetical protein